MNKRFLNILFFILFATNPFVSDAEPVDTIPAFYQKHIKITDSSGVVTNVRSTADGGQIICGGIGYNVGFNWIYPRDGAMVSKVSPQGLVQWCKRVGVPPDTILPPYGYNYDESFNTANELPDGSIVAAGQFHASILFSDSLGLLVCRFSPEGDLLWAKGVKPPYFFHRNYGRNVFPLPNGNFIVQFEITKSGSASNIYLTEWTPGGELLWGKRYINDSGLDDIYMRLLGGEHTNLTMGGDGIYIISENNYFHDNRRRPGILHMGLDGQHKWCRYYEYVPPTADTTTTHGIYQTAGAMLPDGFLIGCGTVVPSQGDVTAGEGAYLVRTDTSGNLLWANQYRDSVTHIIESVHGIQRNPINGRVYVTFGQDEPLDDILFGPNPLDSPEEDYILAEIDSLGNILWQRRLGQPGLPDSAPYLNLTPDGGLMVAGYTCDYPLECQWYIAKTTADGFAGGCNERPIDIQTTNITGFTQHDLPVRVEDWGTAYPLNPPLADITPLVTDLCPDVLLPDLYISNSLVLTACQGMGATLHIDICNIGGVGASGIHLSAYDGPPSLSGAHLLATRFYEIAVQPGGCATVDITVPMIAPGALHLAVNDDGSLALPWLPAQLPPDGVLRETVLVNNFSTVTVDTLFPAVQTELTLSIEMGDTFNVGPYTATGQYVDTLTTANGCDSIVHLTLTVLTSTGGAAAAAIDFKALPNPFGQSVRFRFNLPYSTAVRIRVFDVLGREVAVPLPLGGLAAGRHSVAWDGGGLPPGAYLARLEAGGAAAVLRLVRL